MHFKPRSVHTCTRGYTSQELLKSTWTQHKKVNMYRAHITVRVHSI